MPEPLAPFVSDADFALYVGDALEVLRGLPAESVHCIVTSPPYWGLRDYGTGAWDGGDPDCDHLKPPNAKDQTSTLGTPGHMPGANTHQNHAREPWPAGACGKCGARRVDQQLGLEATPDAYVANVVEVFRGVRRVLRRDGTCWLNLGDSYAAGGNGARDAERWPKQSRNAHGFRSKHAKKGHDVKPKDLVGIPWRVAFALQADGWCLRSEVIWSKPNPMPESVTDRPTKAHEQLFLLTPCRWVGAVEPWPMTREDAIWLAAIVDGEGTICFQEKERKEWAAHISCRLSVVNTNRALLERVSAITNIAESTTPSPRLRANGAPGRPVFTWQVTNEKAARIIAAIRPHLIAKQAQAELAIFVHTLNQKHKGRGGHRTSDVDLERKRKAAAACSALNHGEDVDLGWFKPVRPGRWVPPKDTFYDADSIREPHSPDGRSVTSRTVGNGSHGNYQEFGHEEGRERWPNGGRNRRSVWEIATQPYPEAHFATFPEALVEPCILAGCPEWVCGTCGKPRERIVAREQPPEPEHRQPVKRLEPGQAGNVGAGGIGFRASRLSGQEMNRWRAENPGTESWSDCGHNNYQPGVVLDPFLGSGTTAKVARRHGRRSIGIELSPEYARLAAKRLSQLSLLADAASSVAE